MSVGVEALFPSALGLQPPWVVEAVKLDVAKKRINFEVECVGALLICPACSIAAQPVHDRLQRCWRHLDLFQVEAWLLADVPRVACGSGGKTTHVSVPWARSGSGLTAAFEASALALSGELTAATHWLQRSAHKSARACRRLMALREVHARARQHNGAEQADDRLETFKKLAATAKERSDAVVRGMFDHRSNAFVELMNGQLQQVKRAARGCRTVKHFIAIAYLRLSRLENLPVHPFSTSGAVR